jgi:hypothetical protein
MLDQAAEMGMVYFDVSGGDPLTLERSFLGNALSYASQNRGTDISFDETWIPARPLLQFIHAFATTPRENMRRQR